LAAELFYFYGGLV